VKEEASSSDSSPQKVLIKDVAKAAGVSPSTASYALRDYDRLSADTIQRVKAAAKKLGYVPSPVMQALAEHRWRQQSKNRKGFTTLALVHSYRRSEWPGGPNRQHLLQALQQRAQDMGFKLEIFDAGRTPASQKHLSRILYNRGILGVFIAPFLHGEAGSVTVELDWQHFCPISVVNEQPNVTFHAVMPSWVKNRSILLSKLSEKCVKRVGTFVTRVVDEWHGGLAHTMTPHFNIIGNLPEDWIPPQIAEGYDKAHFLKWFQTYQPEVVLTNIEWVPTWLREIGYRVPEEKGVIFIDNTQQIERSGIDILPVQIAHTALELMQQLLRANSKGIPRHPYRITVPGRWNEGQSCKFGHSRSLSQL
jgi:DNA-binding LacI/PurR family transcriptional regulator